MALKGYKNILPEMLTIFPESKICTGLAKHIPRVETWRGLRSFYQDPYSIPPRKYCGRAYVSFVEAGWVISWSNQTQGIFIGLCISVCHSTLINITALVDLCLYNNTE